MPRHRPPALIMLALATLATGCDVEQPPTSPTTASTFTLTGLVRDGHSAHVVDGAQVQIIAGLGTGMSVNTNAAGEFTLASVPPGAVTLRALKDGYLATDRTITVEANTNLDILLIPSAAVPPTPTPTPTPTPVPTPSPTPSPSPSPAPSPAPSPSPVPPAPLTTLAGQVFEADSKTTGVTGARVEIVGGPNGGRTAMTDSNGGYVIANLVRGTGTVRVSRIGNVVAQREIEMRAADRRDETFILSRTTFRLSGQVRDALGNERFYGDQLYLPQVIATSMLTGRVVGTPAGNGYSFSSLPWGSYTLRAAEQNGSTTCFSAAQEALVVTPEDIDRGTVSIVRDFSLQRRRGNIVALARERASDGESRPVRGVTVEIVSSASVPTNVGRSGVSGDRLASTGELYNLLIADIACDEVRLRVTFPGGTPREIDTRLNLFDHYSFGSYTPAREFYFDR